MRPHPTCGLCGAPITAGPLNQEYCSRSCSRRAAYARAKTRRYKPVAVTLVDSLGRRRYHVVCECGACENCRARTYARRWRAQKRAGGGIRTDAELDALAASTLPEMREYVDWVRWPSSIISA